MPTPTMSDLRNAIRNLLTNGGLPSNFLLLRNRADAAYEAYIFSLVLRAVDEAKGDVQLRSIGSPNQPPLIFIFRGSPGYINSSLSDYGYALCTLGGKKPFEVHLDVMYSGTSSVLHEVDVSLLLADEARRCRNGATIAPAAGKAFGIIECKFYSRNLGTALIRTFVGLKAEFSSSKLVFARFVTNNSSLAIERYCAKNTRPYYDPEVTPLNPDEESGFVENLKQDWRSWLGR